MYLLYLLHFFFFKQKTVYEMRISNCSSDVCSSDLAHKKRAGVTSGPSLKSLRCRSGAGDVGRVDLYSGAHRRRQRDLFDIFALRARRLPLDDRIAESVEVLAGLFLSERPLAAAGVADAYLLRAELDLTSLESGRAHVWTPVP